MSTSDPPRKNGRPPLAPNDPSVNVHFRLPGSSYDDLYQRAQRERTTIGDVIRRSLRRDDNDDD